MILIARYGRKDCNHEWRYCKDHWVDECMPAVCIKCGALGCICDVNDYCGGWDKRPPKDIFFGEAQPRGANINGNWVNPYVKPTNTLNLDAYYIIEQITDLNNIPRGDDLYPLRAGRRVKFVSEPQIGEPMVLEYCSGGEDMYEGYLKTSLVQTRQLSITGGEIITTLNSVYYIEPVR